MQFKFMLGVPETKQTALVVIICQRSNMVGTAAIHKRFPVWVGICASSYVSGAFVARINNVKGKLLPSTCQIGFQLMHEEPSN
jgi:hypothetical protein